MTRTRKSDEFTLVSIHETDFSKDMRKNKNRQGLTLAAFLSGKPDACRLHDRIIS